MAKTRRVNRSIINTPVDTSVKNNFKDACSAIGCPMSVVLETFMREFADNKFSLGITRNAVEVDSEETSCE